MPTVHGTPSPRRATDDRVAEMETRRLAHGDVTATPALVDTLAALVEQHDTLYDWAASVPQGRALRGRAPVYVATLPVGLPTSSSVPPVRRETTAPRGETVVVRHAWHGGLFAPLTRDRYRRPSRAPVEVARSRQLLRAGIPTTTILGFARYDAGAGLCRVDVVSRFVPDAFDLGAVASGTVPGIALDEALASTQELLRQLAHGGVVHPDLNVKNVLVTRDRHGTLTALVIDVDVVRFVPNHVPASVMHSNVRRLTRSLRKWRTRCQCDIPDALIAGLIP